MQGSIETRVGVFVLGALLVLGYMGLQIGAFRFDRHKYNSYTVFFQDISGLSRKAEVKIAGVKVGWVESITLLSNGAMEAQATISVFKQYTLHEDSYAVIRQEGLLGPKYLEVVTGDPLLPPLKNGATLSKPSIAPVTVDDLMHQFKSIASNVESVSDSLRGSIGGEQGKHELRAIFSNLNKATENLALFSDVLQRSFVDNEGNIEAILEIGQHIRTLSNKLEEEVLPAVKTGIEKISGVFDRDLSRIAQQLETTIVALEEASLGVRDGFKNFESITAKIDEGEGLVGKLINNDETYQDIKVAVEGLKNYFNKVDKLQIIFDTHFETMMRPAENYDFEDSKGYFNVRIHPTQDYFFMLQVVGSEKGFVNRYEVVPSYIDCNQNYVDTSALNLTDNDKLENVFVQRREIFTRGDIRFGLQLGKIFGDVAFRLGLFENSVGGAVDVDVPVYHDNVRWVTTLEVFDFRGWNRRDDRRPHAKWLNRMYFLRNIYFAFGADDFISRRNGSIFFGTGIRFGDDDVKYFLPGLAGAAGSSGGGLQQVIAINQN